MKMRRRCDEDAMNRLPSLPLMLIIALPATSVVLGIIMMIVAFSGPDQEIPIGQTPLSKVSWESGRSVEKEQASHITEEPLRDD